jgi:SRSO17 transposase
VVVVPDRGGEGEEALPDAGQDATLVRVAGRHWRIGERCQTGKGLCGLDQHQVRRWRSWYRWTTLAMLAHAFLVVAALADHTRHHPGWWR